MLDELSHLLVVDVKTLVTLSKILLSLCEFLLELLLFSETSVRSKRVFGGTPKVQADFASTPTGFTSVGSSITNGSPFLFGVLIG